MTRAKAKSRKGPISPADKASPKKRRKGAEPAGSTTLPVIGKIKERAKQQHKHAKKTRQNYDAYVGRGQTWLKAHFSTVDTKAEARDVETGGDSESFAVSSDAYEDVKFRDALERMPNEHSDKALALLISFKCFHENCGQSTCDGIYSAFKKLWEEASVLGIFASAARLVLTTFHECIQRWRHLPWQVAFQRGPPALGREPCVIS
jgi:hypothetical protein